MIPCCNSGIDIIRRLIYTSDNMTLPKRKGYSPPSNKCLSSKLRPTRIKESHILSHPLCTAFLLEKYKLKMILQNIANDILEKPSFILLLKLIVCRSNIYNLLTFDNFDRFPLLSIGINKIFILISYSIV